MSSKTLLVGITGGIGSGKSLVCKIFETLNIPTYYADDRAKWLMNNHTALRESIVALFGEEAYENDQLNRTYLSELAFNNNDALKKLNHLVHPAVKLDFENWVADRSKSSYVLKEAALIFEASGNNQELDKVITVYTPEDTRIKRVLARDPHRNEAGIRAIIDKQLSEEEKISRADYVIKNDESQSLIRQVLEIDKNLKQLAK